MPNGELSMKNVNDETNKQKHIHSNQIRLTCNALSYTN